MTISFREMKRRKDFKVMSNVFIEKAMTMRCNDLMFKVFRVLCFSLLGKPYFPVDSVPVKDENRFKVSFLVTSLVIIFPTPT